MRQRIQQTTGGSATARIERAIEAVGGGEPILVVDSLDLDLVGLECTGELVIAASEATAGALNFMITCGGSRICVPMASERLAELELPVTDGRAGGQSPGAGVGNARGARMRSGPFTGNSAAAVRNLADAEHKLERSGIPDDIFLVPCAAGGVLARTGHPEAAGDLARLAGLTPVAATCEVIRRDGNRPLLSEVLDFADEHGLVVIAIAELVRFRHQTERLVTRECDADLPTHEGSFRVIGYRDELDGREHLALVHGEIEGTGPTVVRVHAECLAGDAFRSRICDCGDQLRVSLASIVGAGRGVCVYVRGDPDCGAGPVGNPSFAHGSGVVRPAAFADGGGDVALDRSAVGTQILTDLGIREVRLLTNDPEEKVTFERCGLQVSEVVSLGAEPGPVPVG